MRKYFNEHQYFAGFLFLLALVVVVFLPVLIGRQTLFSAVPGLATTAGPWGFSGLRTPWTLDPGAYMWTDVPQTILWYQSLAKGIFAFWNPYQGLGQPLSGDILTAAYDPIKIVLFGLFPYLKTFDIYAILRILIAGFGIFLFLKQLRLSQRASLAGAIAYMFSGYFMLWLTQWSLGAEMMTPYILWCIERLFAKTSRLNIFLLAVSIALMVLSGVPEAVIVITLFAFAYFLFKFFSEKDDRARPVFGFLIASCVALLAATPMLWDMVLFIRQGVDAHAPILATFAPVPPPSILDGVVRVLQLFFPPSSFLEVARLGGLYADNQFVLPYFVTIVLLLAIAAVSFKDSFKRHAYEIFFAAYAIFFLLLLSGIPPFNFVAGLPVLDRVIFVKYCGTLYFAMAVLAGFGFAHLEHGTVDRKKILAMFGILVAIVAATAIISPTFRASYALHVPATSLAELQAQLVKLPSVFAHAVTYLISHPYAYAWGVVLLTLVMAALFFFLISHQRYTPLVFLLLFLELFLYMPKIRDGGFHSFNPFATPPFVTFLKSRPDIDQYRIFATGQTLEPDVASVYGLHDLRTNDPTYLQNYISFLTPVLGTPPLARVVTCWCVTFQGNELTTAWMPVFDESGVKYIISETPLALPGLTLIYNNEVKIYENPDALPMAHIVEADGAIVPATITDESNPNQLMISASSSEPGTLVIEQVFYPGWRVSVDGGPVMPVIPVDGVFQGVAVPSGNHTVTLSYSPFR